MCMCVCVCVFYPNLFCAQDNGVVIECEAIATAEEAEISSTRFQLILPSAYWEGGQAELNSKYVYEEEEVVYCVCVVCVFACLCCVLA